MHISSLIVHEQLQRLGWPLLGGAALVLLGLLYGTSLVPQWQQLQALRAQDAQLAEQVRQLARGERQVAVQAQDPLQDLHRQLPAQPQATDLAQALKRLRQDEHAAAGELLGDLSCQRRFDSAPDIYFGQLVQFQGGIGSELGARRVSLITLRRLLAAVMAIAAARLLAG